MADIFKKIFFLILGIFFSLILLEISLSAVAFTSVALKEGRNRVNFFNNNTYRIMCLGESTTGCSNYPQILEKYLNEKTTGIKFTVFNKGVTATNSSYILEHLERNLEECKPSLVVVMMGINDNGIKYYETVPGNHSFLFNNFRVYRFFSKNISSIANKLKESRIGYLNRIKSGFIKDDKWLEEGSYCLELGKYRDAEKCFKKRIEEDPNDGDAYRQLGVCYYGQAGRYKESIIVLKRAIALNSKDYKAYAKLGLSLIGIENYDQAIEMFEMAIKLNLEDKESHLGLATAYNLKGNFIEAEKILLKLVENNDDHQIYTELGWNYIKQNKFQNVDDLFKKAIKAYPAEAKIYGIFSVLYAKMGRDADSETCSNKANEIMSTRLNPVTIKNYQKLKKILDKRKVGLICMQYPMRDVAILKNIFSQYDAVTFVDNEDVFKNAIRMGSYEEYFSDSFGGNFGHCNKSGDMLIAKNVADVILNVISRQEP